MHAAIKGTSAGGKSEIRKQVLQFFPPESVVALTSMTEKALIYFEGDLAHKIFSMACHAISAASGIGSTPGANSSFEADQHRRMKR